MTIQVDYNFVATLAQGLDKCTLVTATDTTTGYALTAQIPAKGSDNYAVAELKRFLFEIGRTTGAIQYDKEPALESLCKRVVEETGGLSCRATPTDWKQAHGSVGALNELSTDNLRRYDYKCSRTTLLN